ncbi:MAG: DNA polymerase IV, partial [Deltaproteobacteria bacterium]|nr:DNA polymerase IV [Deltaproteobacteria bacterium]
MDAFYASVEQRDDPSLRGKPVVVGGRSKRGVVSAASYEARVFGVHSAMPMVEALRRCPDAVVVGGHMKRYAEVSKHIFEIFRRYSPLVQGLSLDEAFIDVTGSQKLFGDGETIAALIRRDIRSELELTASAGVAPSKFVAKIASDFDKPDGLTVVRPGEVTAFLTPLSLDRMWGVGPRAAAHLREHGFETIGDLATAPEGKLTRILGSWGASVGRLARGEDDREVVVGEAAKSVGAEQTFEKDLRARCDVERHLLAQARRVARRLVQAGLCGQVVATKLKYADFTVRTRQMRLSEPVDDTDSIYEAAVALLDRFPRGATGVRLTGVSVSDLMQGPPPPVLFPDEHKERR